MVIAFGFRLSDMRQPQVYVSALTGGQRQEHATLAWIEGALRKRGGFSHGRLVVAEMRVDGKLERYATAPLPAEWPECRVWLEEAPDMVQALASCPGRAPVRLTAAGTHIAGLGLDHKPPALYDIYPVTSVEPDKVISSIHRHDLAPPHPLLIVLGLLALSPLLFAAWGEFEKARQLGRKPLLEGVMEHSTSGSLTIRDGERRVSVFIEQGEILSVGLARGPGALTEGDAMVVDGLRAAIQGQVDKVGDGLFRGQETMRLRRGALLVVGAAAREARRRVLLLAGRDTALFTLGMAMASLVAVGLAW
jgi:hypothetical protein